MPSGPSRQGVDKETFASLREGVADTNQSILAPLYEKYRVTPGDKQGLARALMIAKTHAYDRSPHKEKGPIAQRGVLEDEKVFISTLSSAGEQGGPLGAYQDIKRDADAARSASVKNRALSAARSRGMSQMSSGNYSDAAKSFLSAYKMAPEPIAIYNAAQARLKAGDLAGAKELFIKAAMSPEMPL